MFLWNVWLLFCWILFTVGGHTARVTDPGSKPDAAGSLQLPDLIQRSQTRVQPRDQTRDQSARSLRPVGSSPGSESGLEVMRSRRRRSVFLHSGVRICPQESLSEVLSSHRAYYQLRVCQEAVWEAFRIFLDRIPGTSEYQSWVQTCQSESLCISDIALNFSRTDEHLSLVHRRMSRVRDQRPPARGVVTVASTLRPAHSSGAEAPPTITPSPFVVTETHPPSLNPDMTASTSQSQPPVLDSDLNLVPEVPEVPEVITQRTVDLSVELRDPGYRELLEERDSLQYNDLAQHLQEEMQHAFIKLPGFKALSVLEIRPVDRGISVHYSLLFETPPAGIQEDGRASDAQVQTSDLNLQDLIRTALRDAASLPIDLHSLTFSPASSLSPPTSSSSSAPLPQPSEPDSHNEFEVLPEDLDSEKPRVGIPLTPMEKENALVSLLDPTAVSELETTSTGVWSDNPRTQSSKEESEEKVLIITHMVESVTDTGETAELVRSRTTTTEPSFVTTIPNELPENVEDSSPEIIKVTPTLKQIIATPETKEKEIIFETTILSEITGQPPTPALIDEQENAIPDEVKSSEQSKSGDNSEEIKPEFGEILEESEIVLPGLDEESVEEGTKEEIWVETTKESENLEDQKELIGTGENLMEVTRPKAIIPETDSLESPITHSEVLEEIIKPDIEDLTKIKTELERGDGTVIVREEDSEDSEEELEVKLHEETEEQIEQEAKGEVEIVVKTSSGVVNPKEEQERSETVKEDAVVQKPELEIAIRPKQEVDDISEPKQEVEVEEITETKSDEEEVVVQSEEDVVLEDISETKAEPESTVEDAFVFPPTSGEVENVAQTENPQAAEFTEGEDVVPLLPEEEEPKYDGEESVVPEPEEDMFIVHPTPEVVVQTQSEVHLPPEEEEPKYEEESVVQINQQVTTVLPTNEEGRKPGQEVEQEQEIEEETTEPLSESIKVLRPLDGRGGNVFRGGGVEVLEESEEGEGEGEKNVVIIPMEEDKEEEEREAREEVEEEKQEEMERATVDEKREGTHESQMETTAAPESATSVVLEEPEEKHLSTETFTTTPQDKHLTPSSPPEETDLIKPSPPKEIQPTHPQDKHQTPTSPPEESHTIQLQEEHLTKPSPPPEVAASSAPASDLRPSIDFGLLEFEEQPVITASPSVTSTSAPPGGAEVEVIDEDLEPVVPSEEGGVSEEREEEEEEEVQDLAVELQRAETPAEEEEDGSALEMDKMADSVTLPPLSYLTTPTMTSSQRAPELVVFFSLRVTNLDFSEDLFNKTSSEYKALESRFREMLLPYLQDNLTGFRALEVLSFSRGSVVVSSKMSFTRWVPYNVTAAVQNVLEEFCANAARRRSIVIDRRSLDVEPADRADPCKFLACPEPTICEVEPATREPHCRHKSRVEVPVWS